VPEYEDTLTVEASPQAVFDFVSDVANLPKYLPTTHHAEPQQGERVRVQGEAAGHRYDSDGWFRADRTEYRLEWGSDGENLYSGWLEIDEGTDPDSCTVTVHLSFQPKPHQNERLAEQGGGDRDATIQRGLEAALQSIKNLCEGEGGKVEPPQATRSAG
jgi:ribosome-associated toxin RatA of RatAB toxin-antitoxin module